MDISSGKLGMINEDTRTEEEKEKAIEEEAKKLNDKPRLALRGHQK